MWLHIEVDSNRINCVSFEPYDKQDRIATFLDEKKEELTIKRVSFDSSKINKFILESVSANFRIDIAYTLRI
jgi:hypothetical protein